MEVQPGAKSAADLVIRGATEVLTCVPAEANPAGRRKDCLVAISGERILAVGDEAQLSKTVDWSGARVYDARGKIIAPGFVDCHTHLVFGGSRVAEYAARMTHSAAELEALEIPKGIRATVMMTRAESEEELTDKGLTRLDRMLRHGTTTVESKSGYGLRTQDEIKLLRVNRRLAEESNVDVVSTFLGAHDFPPEQSPEDYIRVILEEMIPAVAQAGLAEFIDVYCDEGYYSVEQSRRILEAGAAAGLKPKMHVDAYANMGGATLAAGFRAVSADHLNFTTAEEARQLGKAGVIGVVMPALDFAVGHSRPFDARMLMAQGLKLALATDFCPACWAESMQFVMALACRLYGFSPEEALLAATINAAHAVDLAQDRGSIEPGKLADLQVWDLPVFEDVIYRLGNNAVEAVVRRGQVIAYD